VNLSGDQLVFVYGTLKRGERNHAFLEGQTFRGNARTAPGFRLISLGEYPGIIPDSNDRAGVAGEVWSIDETCLARLDEFEGVAEGLYRRERILLQPPFSEQEVQSYIYALNPMGRPFIPDGVWAKSRPKKKQ
jgi:gamma-glutamylcyclotransferase (GGCT)/AIG2-like uncharacterized protein YtfP